MPKLKKTILFMLCAIFVSACATPRAAVNPAFDFDAVKSIQVGNFGGGVAGMGVQSAFIRRLLAMGFAVRTDGGADVIIDGAVTTYVPNRNFLIRTPEDRRGNIFFMNDVTEIGGSAMYDLGTAFGIEGGRIMASNAIVGISAFMKDASTGEIVWSFSHTHQSLDLQGALNNGVRFVLRTLPRSRPQR